MSQRNASSLILRIYFALVSFVTLMILVFSVSDMIKISLETYVLPEAAGPAYTVYCNPETQGEDVCKRREAQERQRALAQRQRNVLRDISMVLVATPLFWLHFRIAYHDWIARKEETEE